MRRSGCYDFQVTIAKETEHVCKRLLLFFFCAPPPSPLCPIEKTKGVNYNCALASTNLSETTFEYVLSHTLAQTRTLTQSVPYTQSQSCKSQSYFPFFSSSGFSVAVFAQTVLKRKSTETLLRKRGRGEAQGDRTFRRRRFSYCCEVCCRVSLPEAMGVFGGVERTGGSRKVL